MSIVDATLLTPLEAVEGEADRAALQRMRCVTPDADPVRRLPGVPPASVPRHVAIIMDGNGRWAQRRGRDRVAGHEAGASRVRPILDHATSLGVEQLTLYSFSTENWKRPIDEVERLMRLYVEYLDAERDDLVRRNIRFRQIGRAEGLPDEAREALDRTTDATRSCTGATLCLAVNYSSRAEITDAVRAIASRVRRGELMPEAITEATVDGALYTADMPEPDLLIRTAGEMRLSNYLLWQISYAELFVTDVLWPDFSADNFDEAIRAFATRQRRFGGLLSSDEADGR